LTALRLMLRQWELGSRVGHLRRRPDLSDLAHVRITKF
jgi:hypothetical protein